MWCSAARTPRARAAPGRVSGVSARACSSSSPARLPPAARPRRRRGGLEPAGDALVGPAAASARWRTRSSGSATGRQPPVQRAPAPARRRAVDGRGVEGMGELEPVALDAQQPALLRGDEAVRRGGLLDHLDGRVRERGGDEQCAPRVRVEAGDAAGHELAQAVGHRQRSARLERRRRAERAGDLEREERVAARRLGDLQQRRARERVAELRLDQPPHRLEAERTEPRAREALGPSARSRPSGSGGASGVRTVAARRRGGRPGAAPRRRAPARSPRRATGRRRPPRPPARSARRARAASAGRRRPRSGPAARPARSRRTSATSSASRCGAGQRGRWSSAMPSIRSARPTNDSRASACSATQRSTR